MASTGLTFTGLGENDTSVGNTPWATPNNIRADDTSNATCSMGSGNTESQYLKATTFGFAIPAGNNIDGIEAAIECRTGDATMNAATNGHKIVIGGSPTGTAKTTDIWIDSAFQIFTLGSSSDLWGTTPTLAQVNSTDFGCVFSASYGGRGTPNAIVDYVQMNIYYSTTAFVPRIIIIGLAGILMNVGSFLDISLLKRASIFINPKKSTGWRFAKTFSYAQ